jgi:S1-C subfamily serine protease
MGTGRATLLRLPAGSRRVRWTALAVTVLDALILLFTVLMAATGWRRGFLVGALGLAGFVGGALLGTRLAGAVVDAGSHSPYAPLFGLMGALLLGTLIASGFEGVGLRLRRALSRIPGAGALDGALGSVLSATLALAICWVLGAVVLQTPGATELRADVQRSGILRRLNDALPPSGPLLNALARFDPVPSINGPRADVGPPAAGMAADPDVRAARASVVRVTGTACGLGVEGTGWMAGPGLVVTNAHVVAGQEDTGVQIGGAGPRLDAGVVAFDSRDDVAVLRIGGGAGVPALRFAPDPQRGEAAAVLGFPHNGPYDVRGARLGSTRDVLSEDAYGRGPVTRSITTFRATVRPGNSGGPLVDGQGRVLATVFATSRSHAEHTGYGVPDAVVAQVLQDAAAQAGTVSTGPCAA